MKPADDLCARLRDPALSRIYGAAGARICNEAAAEIERLTRERDANREDKLDYKQRAEAADARCAELEQDAKRYRWWRSWKRDWFNSGEIIVNEEIDSAIDIALATKRRMAKPSDL